MAECRAGKRKYETEGEARAALRGAKRAGRGPDQELRIYRCHDDASHWHVSSQASLKDRHTFRKVTAPQPVIHSAAKLRRKLKAAEAEIKAGFKRLTDAEKNYLEELKAVEIMTSRLFGSQQ